MKTDLAPKTGVTAETPKLRINQGIISSSVDSKTSTLKQVGTADRPTAWPMSDEDHIKWDELSCALPSSCVTERTPILFPLVLR